MLKSGLIAAMLSVALGGAAVAEPFQSFADLCIAMNADAQDVEVAAKGSGWTDVTAQMPADIHEQFEDATVFFNFDPAKPGSAPGGSMEIMMTGWSDGAAILDMKGVVLDVCGVMSPGVDPLIIGKRMGEHLGVEETTGDGQAFWIYSRQGDRFVSEAALVEAGDEDLLTAVRSRSLYAVFVFESDGLAGLFVGAVRPAEKAQDR